MSLSFCPFKLLTHEIRRLIPNPDLPPSTPYSTFALAEGFPAL